MIPLKPSLTAKRFPTADLKDSPNGYKYQVIRTTNILKVGPGDILTENEVREMMSKGVTVTVVKA